MTELAYCGLVRHRLPPQIDVHKLPHHDRVVQRLFQPRVRQVEPLLEKVHSQHPLQPYRGPPVAGLWIVRFDQRTQLTPRHNLFHFLQKQSAPGLLGVPLKASHHRQCPLSHAGSNLTYAPCGKGELNQSFLRSVNPRAARDAIPLRESTACSPVPDRPTVALIQASATAPWLKEATQEFNSRIQLLRHLSQ